MNALLATLWYAIAPGDCAEAINAWAHRAEIQVLYDWSAIHNTHCVGVTGEYGLPIEALLQIVRPQYEVERVNARTVTVLLRSVVVVPEPERPEIVLPRADWRR